MQNAGALLQSIAVDSDQQALKELTRLRLRQVMHILRHNPEGFGLSADAGRWVPMNDLHRVLKRTHFERWKDVSLADLFTFARTIGDRLQIKRGKIRATYGHAVGKAPVYEAIAPPEALLHGTSLMLIPKIRQHGLDGNVSGRQKPASSGR